MLANEDLDAVLDLLQMQQRGSTALASNTKTVKLRKETYDLLKKYKVKGSGLKSIDDVVIQFIALAVLKGDK